MPIPVAVGNTTNSEAAFALMEQGAAAVFVGVGPGAACTTREVLGIGVPQVTAISDVAAARDAYLAETGRYVPVVADGGMRRGGELAKAIAAGADVLMIGSPLARAEEAPGPGDELGHGGAVADPPARDPDQGRDGRLARADPARPGPRHRRLGEPRRRAAPVDGGARRARRSATCSGSRWSTRRRSRPRASPGSGAADGRRPGSAGRRARRAARTGSRHSTTPSPATAGSPGSGPAAGGAASGARSRSGSSTSRTARSSSPRARSIGRGRRTSWPTRSSRSTAGGRSVRRRGRRSRRPRPAPRPRRARADPPLRDAVGGTRQRPDLRHWRAAGRRPTDRRDRPWRRAPARDPCP